MWLELYLSLGTVFGCEYLKNEGRWRYGSWCILILRVWRCFYDLPLGNLEQKKLQISSTKFVN